jgi:hypothetical protein
MIKMYKISSRMPKSKSDKKSSRHSKQQQNLTPKSIPGEIWYESRRLHLIGAPISIFKTWWDSVRAI